MFMASPFRHTSHTLTLDTGTPQHSKKLPSHPETRGEKLVLVNNLHVVFQHVCRSQLLSVVSTEKAVEIDCVGVI